MVINSRMNIKKKIQFSFIKSLNKARYFYKLSTTRWNLIFSKVGKRQLSIHLCNATQQTPQLWIFWKLLFKYKFCRQIALKSLFYCQILKKKHKIRKFCLKNSAKTVFKDSKNNQTLTSALHLKYKVWLNLNHSYSIV